MKYKNKVTRLFAIASVMLCTNAATAQVSVPFTTTAQGKSLPINWGMDTAWDDEYNVRWGVSHYGPQFQTGRISFQPYDLVDVSLIDNASANFGLPQNMARKLQQRINRIKLTGTTKVNINCDHEVLTRKLDANGNYGGDEDYLGKANYVSTSSGLNMTYINRWKDLIKACVKYTQKQGLEVVSVSPFNEPDYGWNQFYNGGPGVNTTNQQRYGMRDFLAIAQAIRADEFFKTGEGKDVRVCGPNTLNCDRGLPWYTYSGMAAAIQEGNTHQLAGSFNNYAAFFTRMRQDGKVATGDELHNVGEAIAGVEYGMQNGIWWAFDAKARGQFMHDSNEGVRIGYAEDRNHWTVAAVYRNEKDHEIHGFIGSSERQANQSTYTFKCTDRDVFFNGYGPQREWTVVTKGGTGYQQGQINYEYLFDITYGEDVQSHPIDGNYLLMNASDLKLITTSGYGTNVTAAKQKKGTTQQWHIYPDKEQKGGDCSYWFIDNVGDKSQHLNLRDGKLEAGSKVMTYNASHDALEQWYFRYAGNGYFYITARKSNKYIYNNAGTISLEELPSGKVSEAEKSKYLWRLLPTDGTAETEAPATPTKLAEGDLKPNAISMTWEAIEENNVSYNVYRLEGNGWNTIARCLTETTFTDTNVEAGKAYSYKVQSVDYNMNRSKVTTPITILVPMSETSTVDENDLTRLITGQIHTENGAIYQDIIVPNGLYKVTAVTTQNENSDAALFAETYRSFETKIPAENESTTVIEDILVTNGTMKLGVKDIEAANPATAKSFTLTRISKPEDTDISHYNAALACLDEMTDDEILRYIDHTDLAKARVAAHSCTESDAALKEAVSTYAGALLEARNTPETGLTVGEDLSHLLPSTWTGSTGTYGDAAERRSGDTSPFYSGKILYQSISDLTPGTVYKVDFYAAANVTRSLTNSQQYIGDGIAYVFANDVEQDITVKYQDNCNIEDNLYSLTCPATSRGKILYGIGNRKMGGQWYVAKAKSLSYAGLEHTATLSCNAGEYSTFVAPFEVALPEGIKAFIIESINGSDIKLAEACTDNILPANKPVIIYNSTEALIEQTYTNNVTDVNDVADDGYLIGLLQSDRVLPFNAFVLQAQGEEQIFSKVNDVTYSTANRCYLNKKAMKDNVDAYIFNLPEQENETSISNIPTSINGKLSNAIYDLSGRRIDTKIGTQNLKKGFYIIDGKKMMK